MRRANRGVKNVSQPRGLQHPATARKLRAGAVTERVATATAPCPRRYRGVRKPVTVPSIVNVPKGEVKLWNGIVQVIVFCSGAALADVSVSVIVEPPVGVNVKVISNDVGMKTDVLPMR